MPRCPKTLPLAGRSASSLPPYAAGACAPRAGALAAMAADDIEVSFDEENRIRIMPKEKYKETESLEAQCKAFTEEIDKFGSTMRTLVEILDGEAEKIEQEKLRAIGQRNKAEMEAEARKAKKLNMQATIAEKTQELERLNFQLVSLERAENEQKVLIEKLSNNET